MRQQSSHLAPQDEPFDVDKRAHDQAMKAFYLAELKEPLAE
jgi:hypothetical protein